MEITEPVRSVAQRYHPHQASFVGEHLLASKYLVQVS